jgi:diguanylate cyclase (GGDEF)-like protein
MRVLRRVVLIVSVVSIVAVVVAFTTRTAGLESARNHRLTASAELAAAELAATVGTATVLAAAGSAPDLVADAGADALPGHGLCVISSDATVCRDMPADDPFVVAHEQRRGAGEAEAGVWHPQTRVDVGDRLTIDVDGPHLSVILASPIDPSAAASPATFLSSGAPSTVVFDSGDRRLAAVAVPEVPGLYAVASEAADVGLPAAERYLYLAILGVAIAALLLSGSRVAIDHRSLVRRATTDAVTGLVNRAEFLRRASAVLARHQPSAILLVDLDDFKMVNDTYGHQTGDHVLSLVGRRLDAAVRADDLVARWAGDEFVVLLRGVGSAGEALEQARRIGQVFDAPFAVDGLDHLLRIRGSIGAAVADDRSTDLIGLVDVADRAMYDAKRGRLGIAAAGVLAAV